MNWLRQRLIDDWRSAMRLWSVRLNALGAILLPLLTMVPSMPPEVQAMFPPAVRVTVVALWCMAAIGARLITQKKSGG